MTNSNKRDNIMSKLFTNFRISNLNLKNRLMRSATTSYWSDPDGVLRKPILNYYEKLAKGGVGLIIKGHSYISEKGKAHTGQSGLCSEKHIEQMSKLTDLVHSFDVPILAQLNHAGMASKAERVTASNYSTENWQARELRREEIESIIDDFCSSCDLALDAGFDGVQIHAAHGYLISQFLSPKVNKRQDKYGGSLENRMRLLLDVYKGVRQTVGNKLVSVKINCDDFTLDNGFTINESIQVITKLKQEGIDFVEISGGGPQQAREVRKNRGRADISPLNEATFSGHALKIRKAIPDFTLALVDGIRSRKTMEALLSAGINLISMSKPFIIEPDFPQKLIEGQEKSTCIDCNKCLSRDVFGKKMLKCQYIIDK